MKVDLPLTGPAADAPDAARALADVGIDGVFTFEGAHDPFVPLIRAAGAAALDLYTNVAIGLPRSPMHLAQVAHDLQSLGRGRFLLGLGSQVRAHIERRYGAKWADPTAHAGEQVAAVREILRCWQTGDELHFEGRFHQHTLMPPTFRPAPNDHGAPPVLLAGVGPRMVETAGRTADGWVIHPFNGDGYLHDVALPALERGLATSRRGRSDLVVIAGAIVAPVGPEVDERAARAATRAMVAFYASTPAYRVVLDEAGFGALQPELQQLTRAGRWDDMPALVSDDVVDAIAFVGDVPTIARQLRRRFGGIADRLALSVQGGAGPETLGSLAEELRRST